MGTRSQSALEEEARGRGGLVLFCLIQSQHFCSTSSSVPAAPALRVQNEDVEPVPRGPYPPGPHLRAQEMTHLNCGADCWACLLSPPWGGVCRWWSCCCWAGGGPVPRLRGVPCIYPVRCGGHTVCRSWSWALILLCGSRQFATYHWGYSFFGYWASNS